MTNQTNTSGGASIDGNVDANEFVGRDKTTINNIIVVGRFLEFAQIEGLLPKLEQEQNFASIVEAIESNVRNKLNDDLADAVAWTGEILGELLSKWEVEDVHKPLMTADMLDALVVHVGEKLMQNDYWDAFGTYISYQGAAYQDFVLPLEITTMLYEKNIRPTADADTEHLYIAIPKPPRGSTKKQTAKYVLASKEFYDSGGQSELQNISPHRLDHKARHLIIAGIILDLIRIKSENTISVQFLQSLADTFKPKVRLL